MARRQAVFVRDYGGPKAASRCGPRTAARVDLSRNSCGFSILPGRFFAGCRERKRIAPRREDRTCRYTADYFMRAAGNMGFGEGSCVGGLARKADCGKSETARENSFIRYLRWARTYQSDLAPRGNRESV